ncbi:MAG: DUF1836 domain-containing protein [Clostridia bacterium]|nr:DUF1836 domain-containing protein [Clostridia bacterium]
MENKLRDEMIIGIADFRLPKYNEIPDVGLFLEQTTKYISGILAPLDGITITSSMISNYVKRKLIANPIKKQYSREQIAYLIYIAIAKSVLSLEDIQLMIDMQKTSYTGVDAYSYFCREFEDILTLTFGLKDNSQQISVKNYEMKTMLRNTVVATVHKIYLEKSVKILKKIREEQNNQ